MLANRDLGHPCIIMVALDTSDTFRMGKGTPDWQEIVAPEIYIVFCIVMVPMQCNNVSVIVIAIYSDRERYSTSSVFSMVVWLFGSMYGYRKF